MPGIQNREVEINNFIRFTAGGVKIADFDQILAAIIKRYKQTYGNDIDLSNTTADGVFVYDMALIINNILQSFKILYSNLDVETASGVYLDTLCKLSNVIRKEQTASTATLLVKGITGNELVTGTEFVDNAGVLWKYENDTIILNELEEKTIKVVCETLGAVKAPIGWINRTLEESSIIVTQATAAVVGQEEESDSNLRARRSQSTGRDGVTVLESLQGELLSVGGVRDVKIYNNPHSTSEPALDTTNVVAHGIYVVLRQLENVDVPAEIIGSVIYEKLTPGIKTTPTSAASTNGIAQEYQYVQSVNGTPLDWIEQKVYWKKAVPIHPTLTVTIKPYTFFAGSQTEISGTYQLIKDAVLKYLNNIAISKLPTKNELIITSIYADPQFKNTATYGVIDANIPTDFANPDTYFNYTSMTVADGTNGEKVLSFS